jgi:uncharacterized protein involved in response to NO
MAQQFLQIQQPGKKPHPFALFNLGFRPFFLFAALFSVVSIAVWVAIYRGHLTLAGTTLSPQQWHAHEMLFGYAMAVVAGFLLTAVRNWTNIPTPTGIVLALLLAAWLLARLLMLFAPPQLAALFVVDVGFDLALAVLLSVPLMQARQWKQLGVVSKVMLLGAANALFYLGTLGLLADGVRWGLYSGLYLILSLIFLMARRVVPFFIERGAGYPVQLTNRAWVDRASLVLLLAFWLVEVFSPWTHLASVLAALLVVVHALRLMGWHTVGIWKKPLLWVLFLGYGSMVFGFLLRAMSSVLPLSPYLAVHAFAVGGIGLMTAGMMARVALGHTGRSVQEPPGVVSIVFGLLVVALIARVMLAWALPQWYPVWVELAALAWVLAFAVFGVVYGPMLIKPRVDGQPG